MPFLAIFRSRRMAILFLLGFSSGLPLYLTGQLLNAWLSTAGVSLQGIAAMSVVGLGYTLKFVWAPLLDRYQLPFLGRRRGWAFVSQIGLVIVIIAMGLVDPVAQPGLLAILAAAVAILSASQDVVLDAYSVDLLRPEERAAGASIYVIGYRVAMLLTGTLALFLADFVPWSVIYSVIGALVLVGAAATLAAEEPPAPARPTTSFLQALYVPFVEFYRRFGARGPLLILAFVAMYKFGDHFVLPLLIPFFIRGLDYSLTEIALVYKIVAFAGIFAGGILGGSLVAKHGLRRMLVVFGILQACTNLLYALLAAAGPSYPLFGTAVFVDHLTGQMGVAAFIGFMMSVCSTSVSATQMAMLTSLSSVGQRVFGPFSDDVVNRFDVGGFGQLVASHANALETVRPSFDLAVESAVVHLRWHELPDLIASASWLARFIDPTRDTIVTAQSWPYFFTVTAVMAIPGILLALVVGRKVAPTSHAP